MKRIIMFAMTLAFFPPAANAQTNVLFDAMKDELARSMKELKLENDPGPYYISYLLTDIYILQIQADSGAVVTNDENRIRTLKADVRVGNYARDNSNFLSMSTPDALANSISSLNQISVDDDYDAVRRQIWQATDRAYKTAVDTLNRKNAALQNTAPADRQPDFTKGNATVSISNANTFDVSRAEWEDRVNSIAGLLLRDRNILRSRVTLQIQIANTWYVNSEGAETLEPSSLTRMAITVSSRAENGMPVDNYRVYTTARPEGLPDQKSVEADVTALISGLNAVRTASVGEEYAGPVLFEGESAGELFVQGIVEFLKGSRVSDADNPQITALLNQSANPLINRVNARVAANFLSIKAVPTMKRYGQKELAGAYTVDDEGVPAQDVSLVENGILKNLLMSRTPVRGMEASNGHGRGGTVTPGVIQVISENKKPYDQLKQDLIEAFKEEGLAYGYIIRGLPSLNESLGGNEADAIQMLLGQGQPEPGQFKLTRPYSIFRLYPDGREEQVRGLEIGVVNVSALRNVLATSDDETVYNFQADPVSLSGGLGGILLQLVASGIPGRGNAATIITPSLLINGINLKKTAGVYPKLPAVDSPIR